MYFDLLARKQHIFEQDTRSIEAWFENTDHGVNSLTRLDSYYIIIKHVTTIKKKNRYCYFGLMHWLQAQKATQRRNGSTLQILFWVRSISVRLHTDTWWLWSWNHMADSCIEERAHLQWYQQRYSQVLSCDPDSPPAYLGSQTPQDYGTGFIISYIQWIIGKHGWSHLNFKRACTV